MILILPARHHHRLDFEPFAHQVIPDPCGLSGEGLNPFVVVALLDLLSLVSWLLELLE